MTDVQVQNGAGAKMDASSATDSSRHPTPTEKAADVLAIILMFTFTTAALTLSVMPVVTNELRGAIGLTDAQIGLLTSVFMGFYGVSGVLSGIAAARFGGRVLLVSCSCIAVGSLVFAFSSNMEGFLVGRAVQGAGGGMVISACNPVLAHALPPRMLGRAWGILGSGWGLGIMAALLILPSVQDAGGYQAVFLANAGLGVVGAMAAATQKAIRSLPSHPANVTSLRALARSFVAVATNAKVVLLGLTGTASLATSVGILAWTAGYFQDVYASQDAVAIYLVAGLGAAQLVGNPLGAACAARWSKLSVIVWSLVVMTIATALIGIVPGVYLALVLVLVVGFVVMFLFSPMMAYLPEVVARPEQVGPATGVNQGMGFVGSLVAPWLFGLFLDVGSRSQASYKAGYLMLAAFAAIATAGMIYFAQLVRRSSL